MLVSIQLFAAARDRVGRSTIQVELTPDATVGQLRQRLTADFPQLSEIVPRAMVAVDADYAQESDLLRPSSEIALIPPVSGG